MPKESSFEVKVGLAEMLKGGVIMDVMNQSINQPTLRKTAIFAAQ